MADLKIENIEGGVVFLTKIVPGSSQTRICGLLDGMLKVKISAPPEKGKANQRLLEFLAKQLGVKKALSHNLRTNQSSKTSAGFGRII